MSPRRTRPRRYPVLRASLGARPAPFTGLERVGAKRSRARVLVAVLIALGVHAALFFLGYSTPVPASVPTQRLTQNVTFERPPAPAPAAAPSPEPARSRRPVASRPAAAAAAAKVVARAPAPDEPVDMTGFEMPVGKASSYAGGYTAASGTATHAVGNVASAHGAGNGGSLARSASPSRQDWSCGWPEEEEQSADVRDVRVAIRVHVSADGAAETVDVLGSASPAFSLAARRCALAESYRTARGADGLAVPGVTPSFQVHFVR